MKFYKYFIIKELKEVCNTLENNRCYYRHPKSDFFRYLGKDNVEKLLKLGFIKDSPKLEAYWIDYHEPCYEYTKKFTMIYDWYTTPLKLYIKYYVLRYTWFIAKWHQFRIWCGHHYDWQDYTNVNIY